MFEKAKKLYASTGTIVTIKIFGCGTGREIEQIAKFSLYHKKIKDISLLNNAERMSVHEKEVSIYDLPF